MKCTVICGKETCEWSWPFCSDHFTMTLEYRVPLIVSWQRDLYSATRWSQYNKNSKHITDDQKKRNSDCRLNAKRENRWGNRRSQMGLQGTRRGDKRCFSSHSLGTSSSEWELAGESLNEQSEQKLVDFRQKSMSMPRAWSIDLEARLGSVLAIPLAHPEGFSWRWQWLALFSRDSTSLLSHKHQAQLVLLERESWVDRATAYEPIH